MKILFTAFTGKDNSSKTLLDKIAHENKLYLKNSFSTSVSQLVKELQNNQYDLIVSIGQASLDLDTIKIETTGKGEVEYKTKYNYASLKSKLDRHFKTIISEDAGNYLCNNIYFQGLKYIEKNKLETDMIFIHIPMLNNISNMGNLANVLSEF